MAFTGYSNEGLAMLGQGVGAIGTAIEDYRTRQDVEQALSMLGQAQAGGMPQLGAPAGGTVQVGPLSPLGKQSDAAPIDLKSIPTFVQAAGQGVGIDPSYIARTFQVESGGNPNAVSPTGAKGLGQFTTGTWKTYGAGLGSPFDPNASAMATANLTADNADGLAQALGREPTQGETYLAHQQGLGGARALLSNPNANVVDALAAAYGGDRNKAARAVMVNGGRPDMTAGDFAAKWVSKFPNTPVRVGLGDTEARAPAAGQPMSMPTSAIAAPAGPDGGPAPVATPAAPRGVQVASNDPSFVPQGMQGDFAVRMPDGKLWTVAQAAASNDPNSPYDEDVKAAQEAARRGAALTGGQRPPGTATAGPAAPVDLGAAARGAPIQAAVAPAASSDFVPGSVASPAVAEGQQMLTAPVQFPQSKASQLPPDLAARLLTNPKTANVAQSIISAQYGGKAGAWEIKELPNGQTVLFNPTQGVVPLGASKATALERFTGTDGNDYQRNTLTGQTWRLIDGGPEEGSYHMVNGRLVFGTKTGDTKDATPVDLPQGYRPATAQERTQFGVAPTTPLAIGPDGKPVVLGSGNAGANIPAQIAAREADAKARGLDANDPSVRQYIQTGRYPSASNNPRVLHQGDVLVGPDGKVRYQADAAEAMDDQTVGFLADRVLAGDTRALIGLGRGAQGAQNLSKIQSRVAQKAAEQGLDPTDLQYNAARAAGMGAEQRTLGTQTARMAAASTEAQGAIELGRIASDAVSRTQFVPFNKAIQALQAGTSDPALKAFVASNNTIVNTYARAINPNGSGTISDKDHAREVLSTADGPAAYKAALDQLSKEIELAHQAPNRANTLLEQQRQARKPGARQAAPSPESPAPTAPGAPAPAPAPTPQAIPDGATATNPTTGQRVIRQNGRWVPLS